MIGRLNFDLVLSIKSAVKSDVYCWTSSNWNTLQSFNL